MHAKTKGDYSCDENIFLFGSNRKWSVFFSLPKNVHAQMVVVWTLWCDDFAYCVSHTLTCECTAFLHNWFSFEILLFLFCHQLISLQCESRAMISISIFVYLKCRSFTWLWLSLNDWYIYVMGVFSVKSIG